MCPAQNRLLRVALLCGLGALGACTAVTRTGPDTMADYGASIPQEPPEAALSNGGIYYTGARLTLFEDAKARRVGDIITVLLQEATTAEKSANTDLARTSSADASFGSTGNLGGIDGDRDFTLEGGNTFQGQGDADQSNRLEGAITVTVSRVLSNGNLIVQGEKWITINQGEEYIRLRGIVRPADISQTNTVLSTQVADARISYSGRGAIADSNMPNILTRFFMSAISPF